MIKNAQITSTMLGREDHGNMTFHIFVKFDEHTTCGIGGYTLDMYSRKEGRRVCPPESMELISEILRVVGVDTWEDLKGKYIRIEDEGWGKSIKKIGNIMKDEWIDIPKFFRLFKEELDYFERRNCNGRT